MENRRTNGRRSSSQRSPAHLTVSTVPRPTISPRVQKSGVTGSSPMHLISRNPDMNVSNSDSNQRRKEGEGKNKNVWNNRRAHGTNGHNFPGKKPESRFNKNFNTPPPLTLKKNLNQKSGNASVAILKTGPFSPHANNHKYDQNNQSVRNTEQPHNSYGPHDHHQNHGHAHAHGERSNSGRGRSGYSSKNSYYRRNRVDEHGSESVEQKNADVEDHRDHAHQKSRPKVLVEKKGKIEYSLRELRNFGRSRRVLSASRVRPADLLPMPITKIPYNPAPKKKPRRDSDLAEPTNPSTSGSKMNVVETGTDSYGSGYNRSELLELQNDESVRPTQTMRRRALRDNKGGRMSMDSRRSVGNGRSETANNDDVWEMPDEPWSQESSFAQSKHQEAFEAEHKRMVDRMKTDSSLQSQNLESTTSEDAAIETKIHPNGEDETLLVSSPQPTSQDAKATLNGHGGNGEDLVDAGQLNTAVMESSDIDDILKGFNLLGAIDDGDDVQTSELSMGSLFSFAPLGSSSTIDKYAEMTHGSAFGSGPALSPSERKEVSSGLGKWFSVSEEEEPIVSDSSLVHQSHDPFSDVPPPATSFEPPVTDTENQRDASALLKNMLAVQKNTNDIDSADGVSSEMLGRSRSGRLVESLGLMQTGNESLESSPTAQPAKTKFAFHQQSSTTTSKKVLKSKSSFTSNQSGHTSVPAQPKTVGIAGGFVPISVLKQSAASKSLEKTQAKSKDTSRNGVNLLARLFQTAGAALEGHKETLASCPQMTSVDDLESMIA